MMISVNLTDVYLVLNRPDYFQMIFSCLSTYSSCCQAVRSYKSLRLVMCPYNFSHVEGDIFCSTEYIIHGALLVLDDAISQFD